MKQKTFRVFIDIKAKDKDEALMDVEAGMGDGLGFRVQEDPFTDEEEGTILELARVALSDADTFDTLAYNLDLSDKEMKKLQKKIEAITNRS